MNRVKKKWEPSSDYSCCCLQCGWSACQIDVWLCIKQLDLCSFAHLILNNCLSSLRFQLLWEATSQPGGHDGSRESTGCEEQVLPLLQARPRWTLKNPPLITGLWIDQQLAVTEEQVGACAMFSRCTVKMKTYLFNINTRLMYVLLLRPVTYLCNSPVTSDWPGDSTANFKANL